jgi:hypothetical protein
MKRVNKEALASFKRRLRQRAALSRSTTERKTMEDKALIPASDLAKLDRLSAAAIASAADLMHCMHEDLPQETQARFARLFDSGGQVGVEICVSASGGTRVCLVGETADGQHVKLAIVRSPVTARIPTSVQ